MRTKPNNWLKKLHRLRRSLLSISSSTSKWLNKLALHANQDASHCVEDESDEEEEEEEEEEDDEDEDE